MGRVALIPRLAALILTAFLALFAVDAFHGDAPVVDRVTNVVLHVLPALAVVAILAVAWRRPALGAVGYLTLAILSLLLSRRRPSAFVLTTLPLLVLSGLFLWSAVEGRLGRRKPLS